MKHQPLFHIDVHTIKAEDTVKQIFSLPYRIVFHVRTETQPDGFRTEQKTIPLTFQHHILQATSSPNIHSSVICGFYIR